MHLSNVDIVEHFKSKFYPKYNIEVALVAWLTYARKDDVGIYHSALDSSLLLGNL